MSEVSDSTLLVVMTEMKGQLALSNQKMDGLIALVKSEQDHIKQDNQQIRQTATQDRQNVKMQFEAVEKVLERKADKDAFTEVRGWIIKGIGIVVVSVITALVGMVVAAPHLGG